MYGSPYTTRKELAAIAKLAEKSDADRRQDLWLKAITNARKEAEAK